MTDLKPTARVWFSNLIFNIVRSKLWIGLSLWLFGCSASLELPRQSVLAEPVKPLTIGLEDESGNQLGFATLLKGDVLVTPDHLWQEGGSLYYQDRAIKVLARDFRHDVLFFSVPGALFAGTPNWSAQPPGVGDMLSWKEADSVISASVFSAKADLKIGATEVEDLMQLEGDISAGNSGTPLFDANTGVVYGLVVAGDSLNKVSYFVRSDVVLDLAGEYLD